MIYAHVITTTGWTWDYIDYYLDLPRLNALLRYWGDHPPVHIMIAAYLGIEPGKGKNGKPAAGGGKMIKTHQDVHEFMACFQAAGGVQI